MQSILAERLLSCGLFWEQIERLERILPLCKAILAKRASLNDVRGRLRTVADGLRDALSGLEGSDPATGEAIGRLVMKACEDDAVPFDDMQRSLERVAQYAESALEDLTDERSRFSHAAHPSPVRWMDDALHQGFAEHFHRAGTAMPPYELAPSREGRFFEIVSICYEAIGYTTEPNRAVRAYVEFRARIEEEPATRTNIKVVSEPPTSPSTSPAAGIAADGPFSLVPRVKRP
jgi:hypothetical protein